MISKDKYEALESRIGDRNLFSHLAVAFATFSLSLGVERGAQYLEEGDQLSANLLVVCGVVLVLALVFGVIAVARQRGIDKARTALFDSQRIVADEQTLITSDGTQIIQRPLTNGATVPQQQTGAAAGTRQKDPRD